ncbi:MAG: hypothetical protein AAFN79_12490 [Pseudomonadota bacterium]
MIENAFLPKGELLDFSEEGARFFYGEKARARTVADCIIEPLRRFRVPGGAVIGACGHETTTPYEIRLSKKDGTEIGVFLTGSHSGEALIDAAGLRRPLFVDPLRPSAAVSSGPKGGGGGGGARGSALTRLNREVYVAIDLILIAWNKREADGLFAALLSQINSWPDRDLFASRIKPLNSALRNSKTHMRNILWLAAKRYENDGELRDIDFPLIRSKLAGEGIDAHEIMF